MKNTVVEFIWSLNDGGAETLVKDYALLLDRERFDVKVLAVRPYPNTANTRTLKEKGIDVRYIYPRWNVAVLAFNKFFGKYYRPYRILRYLKEMKASAVHIHLQQLQEFAPISDQLKGISLFYTCHNLPDKMFSHPHEAEQRAAEHLIRNNGLRLIALHDAMGRELNQRFGIANTAVIRNGIQLDRFTQVAEDPAAIRRGEDIPADAFVVGHVGRFNRQKNHVFLLEVFEKICRRRSDAFLLLIGDGELRELVKAMAAEKGISDRVKILSNRTDIPRLMKAMDLFLFPSVYEGLGIALIEAQTAGLRCIVSDAVPQEAFRTPLAVPVSLEESADRWAQIALDRGISGPYHSGLDAYDMRKEIKRLEALYLGE